LPKAAAEREEDEEGTVQASVKEGKTAPLVDAPKAGEEARALLVEAKETYYRGKRDLM
jgi:hypothetical protein